MLIDVARYRIVERDDGSFAVQWLAHRWVDVHDAVDLGDARRWLISKIGELDGLKVV